MAKITKHGNNGYRDKKNIMSYLNIS